MDWFLIDQVFNHNANLVSIIDYSKEVQLFFCIALGRKRQVFSPLKKMQDQISDSVKNFIQQFTFKYQFHILAALQLVAIGIKYCQQAIDD